jgi:zinc/manganese transport system substrate-binding protein
VVVTTEILGALVAELVGESAEVIVLMPAGANPHTWEPSARDVELALGAAVLVSNGLDLEEGLVSVLESAAAEGATWFEAADHVTQLGLDGRAGEDEADPEDHDDHEGEDEHDHGSVDPHIWTDPLAMADVVAALAPVLADAGIDVGERTEAMLSDLQALDATLTEILAVVPADARKLITGHRSLGYFAERYGFEQVGSVIASLSTDAEPTARELAELIEQMRVQDVPVLFVEAGTPQAVAEAVAGDGGAELIELDTAELPAAGTYAAFMVELATTVAEALGSEGR